MMETRHEIKCRIKAKVHLTEYVSSAISDMAGAIADEVLGLKAEIEKLKNELARKNAGGR